MLLTRILSLVIALVASVVGLAVLWIGGVQAYQAQVQFRPGASVGGVALAILGALLLAIAAASVWLSSLGVIVVGALHVVGSALTVLAPFDLIKGVRPPTLDLLFGLSSIDRGLSDGGMIFTATGMGLVLGAGMIGAGVGAHLRARAAVPAANSQNVLRVVLAVVGTVVGLAVVAGAVAAGWEVYRSEFMIGRSALPMAALLVVLALVFGAVLATTRWTSLAPFVVGATLALVGVVGALVPPRLLPRAIEDPLFVVSATFFLVALGLSVLGLGVGAAVRTRRREASALPATASV